MLKELPLSKVYQFIEPGPVTLLTTRMADAKSNVMAMTWHMIMDFEPPLIGCIVGQGNHSFAALSETRECVIAVPPASMAKTVVALGNCTGADTDKFATYEITALPASHVHPPLIEEAIVNLECRVKDMKMVNPYNFFVLECVHAWENPALWDAPTLHHHGYGAFTVDGERIKLKSRMR